MSYGVTLNAATRRNLQSLQDTSARQGTTRNRYSTAKKVSSALDNPVTSFTSKSLERRSGALSSLLDGVSHGVQAIRTANQGITSIQKLVDQAKSVADQALSTPITTAGTAGHSFTAPKAATTISLFVNGTPTSAVIPAGATIDQAVTALDTAVGAGSFSKDLSGEKIVIHAKADVEFATAADQKNLGFAAGTGTGATYGSTTAAPQSSDLTVSGVARRASLAKQFNGLLTEIDQMAGGAGYDGGNLIAGKGIDKDLTIGFGSKGTLDVMVAATDETSDGLGLKAITATSASTSTLGQGNFLLDSDVSSTLDSLTTASDRLRSDSSAFGSALSVVLNRQDFTKNLINVLEDGAASLTGIGLDEEAANVLALSTRQTLGISALSLANQASQGILQLLR